MTASDAIRIGLAARDYDGEVIVTCHDGARFRGVVVDVQPHHLTITTGPHGDLAFALAGVRDLEIA